MKMARTVVILTAATALTIGATGVWFGVSDAGPAGTPHDREHLAASILDHWSRSPMTAASVRGLRARANRGAQDNGNAHNFARIGTSQGGDSPNGQGVANTRVNDPAQDSHATDQTTQSETSVAVSGSNVVVGFNDSQQALFGLTDGLDFSGYAYSSDGGSTFTDGGTLPNPGNFVNLGDPWLASDRNGNLYYSTLSYGGNVGNLEISVAKSTDGGKTFATPGFASPNNDGLFYFGDKDALTVGPSPTNKNTDVLYDTWDDTSCDPATFTCSNGLPVSHSTDGGKTWTLTYADKLRQDPTSCSFAQYIGAQPLVDRKDGTLYVAAEKLAVDDPNCTFDQPFTSNEVLFRSTDGGQTFGAATTISAVTPATRQGALNLGAGHFIRTIEFPTLAISDGKLYAAWNDGASGNSHIKIAKSADGGTTWASSNVTQGSGDELQPSLTANNKGLHLAYYQRNKDNTLDVNEGTSADGNTWTTKRITSQSFPGVVTVPQFDPQIAFGYMGDYIASTTDGNSQFYAWGDNRNTITNYTHPAGRHDPDVYFARK